MTEMFVDLFVPRKFEGVNHFFVISPSVVIWCQFCIELDVELVALTA